MSPESTEERRDEQLGRMVRKVWLEWLVTSPSGSGKRPASWSAEWDDLKEEDKEVDRRIGRALFDAGFEAALEKSDSLALADLKASFTALERAARGDKERWEKVGAESKAQYHSGRLTGYRVAIDLVDDALAKSRAAPKEER